MSVMRAVKQPVTNEAGELAAQLAEALQRERIVPRFVDSYVVEHGRHGLQVHAALYRDLLELLQREALIAASVHAMELITRDYQPTAKRWRGIRNGRWARRWIFRRISRFMKS
jgi:hypothetical protein